MYERSYGNLYDRDRPVKEDAALIRRNIKGLVDAGLLPADWKYSVRYRTASMMRAIDVRAFSPRTVCLMRSGYYAAAKDRDRVLTLAREGVWESCLIRKGDQWHVAYADVESAESRAVRQTLDDLLNSCNHDGSDIQSDYFDVKYYGQVTVDTLPGVPLYEREVSYLPASCTA